MRKMPDLILKTKYTLIAWLLATLSGTAVIMLGAPENIGAFGALAMFSLIYHKHAFANRHRKFELAHADTIISDSQESLEAEIKTLALRARQICSFHPEWQANYKTVNLKNAFEQAFYQVLDKDNETNRERLYMFSETFTSYIDTFEMIQRKSCMTLDDLIIDIQQKDRPSELQKLFIVYISKHIRSLPHKERNGVDIIYKFHNEHLMIRELFDSWFGARIAALFRVLDSRKSILGIQNLLSINVLEQQSDKNEASL